MFSKSADTNNLQNKYADYRHFADNLPIGKSADIEAYLPIFILSAEKRIFCQDNEKYGHKQMIDEYADLPRYLQICLFIGRYADDDMRK